jgi:hypothetical protein
MFGLALKSDRVWAQSDRLVERLFRSDVFGHDLPPILQGLSIAARQGQAIASWQSPRWTLRRAIQ